jgi:hypothetical protein
VETPSNGRSVIKTKKGLDAYRRNTYDRRERMEKVLL